MAFSNILFNNALLSLTKLLSIKESPSNQKIKSVSGCSFNNFSNRTPLQKISFLKSFVSDSTTIRF